MVFCNPEANNKPNAGIQHVWHTPATEPPAEVKIGPAISHIDDGNYAPAYRYDVTSPKCTETYIRRSRDISLGDTLIGGHQSSTEVLHQLPIKPRLYDAKPAVVKMSESTLKVDPPPCTLRQRVPLSTPVPRSAPICVVLDKTAALQGNTLCVTTQTSTASPPCTASSITSVCMSQVTSHSTPPLPRASQMLMSGRNIDSMPCTDTGVSTRTGLVKEYIHRVMPTDNPIDYKEMKTSPEYDANDVLSSGSRLIDVTGKNICDGPSASKIYPHLSDWNVRSSSLNLPLPPYMPTAANTMILKKVGSPAQSYSVKISDSQKQELNEISSLSQTPESNKCLQDVLQQFLFNSESESEGQHSIEKQPLRTSLLHCKRRQFIDHKREQCSNIAKRPKSETSIVTACRSNAIPRDVPICHTKSTIVDNTSEGMGLVPNVIVKKEPISLDQQSRSECAASKHQSRNRFQKGNRVHNKYPCHNLRSRAVKEALLSHVVAPIVLHNELVTSAYRVTWRVSENLIDEAWAKIHDHRQKCDAAISGVPGVCFFVSAITGVFSKPTRKCQTPKAIYPAISYWLVSNRECELDKREIVECFEIATFGAEVKRVEGRFGRTPHGVTEEKSAGLFITVKDYPSFGYVYNKLCDANGSSEQLISKIVVKEMNEVPNLIPDLVRAIPELHHAGLPITLTVCKR